MKSDCIFCSIIRGELPASIVYQDELTLAFLDIQPINEGHTLVIPKEHAAHLADLPAASAGHMMKVAQKVTAALYKSELDPSGINLILADGASAGQEVFHSHLHVLPRHEGDDFGFKHPEVQHENPSRAVLDETADHIRERVESL